MRKSHFDLRMKDEPIEVCKVPTTEKVQVVSNSFENGLAQTKVEWVDQKLAERDKGLKWYDFSLDALVASGAVADLKFSQLNQTGLGVADSFDSVEFNIPAVENIDTEVGA